MSGATRTMSATMVCNAALSETMLVSNSRFSRRSSPTYAGAGGRRRIATHGVAGSGRPSELQRVPSGIHRQLLARWSVDEQATVLAHREHPLGLGDHGAAQDLAADRRTPFFGCGQEQCNIGKMGC